MSSDSLTTHARPTFLPALFQPRPVGSWIAIGTMMLYLLLCWAAFFAFVEPAFEGRPADRIEADSATYYEIADQMRVNRGLSSGKDLLTFNANLIGPVVIAQLLRTPFFVVLLNCFLFAAMTQTAALIPGVRRRFFCLLMALNAQTLVSIATLNKEILASFGLVAFMASRLQKRHRVMLLVVAFTLSIMARWEQAAILLLYMLLESRISLLRRRHLVSLLFVIGVLTVAYVIVVRYSSIDIAAFLAQNTETAGPIARMAEIQANFGFPLVVLPRAVLNLTNRALTPNFFWSDAYLTADFTDLQNQFISQLQGLATAVLLVVAFLTRRMSLRRPIPYFIALYVIVTSVSPFIQPRYQYPVYALLCLELARTGKAYIAENVALRDKERYRDDAPGQLRSPGLSTS
jgi:hypothetical protein